jgi:hypothetical protein
VSGDDHGHTDKARDVDEIVDELMERAEGFAREMRGDDGPPTYPPGVDPERLRAIIRANLRESIVNARGEVSS